MRFFYKVLNMSQNMRKIENLKIPLFASFS